jgi:predicted metal-binding membrane protein
LFKLVDNARDCADRAAIMTPDTASIRGNEPPLSRLLAARPMLSAAIVVASIAGWAALGWLAFDMGHPLAQLTMPEGAQWMPANVAAIFAMWAIMMASMMLPSALPMTLTFVHLSTRQGERARARMFVSAYLLVWVLFSAAATALQWGLHALGWLEPMTAAVSTQVSVALLLVAGAYQFSPLKKVCLARCRTPMAFLLGEWRPGVRGAFAMGLRHGLFCAGCCWALMVLLFVGGTMNLRWVAALAVAVAIEKLAPHGERVAQVLGVLLIAAGFARLAGWHPF